MGIYSIELDNNEELFNKIFYALYNMAKEYDRKVLIGVNVQGFTGEKYEKLRQTILLQPIKVFLCNDFPPCVFAHVAKYKMCDFSINIEYKDNKFNLILFGGNGYPVCSYQKKSFKRFLNDYKCCQISDDTDSVGQIYNMKLNICMNQYIKHIFGENAKNVRYIKNVYNLYYFKVNDKYYVLDNNFSTIINKNKNEVEKTIKLLCNHTYDFSENDEEFDVFQYMLTRKIPCIITRNSSIIFADSYYTDYLKLIYYMEK